MGRRLRRAGTICTLVMTLSASWSVATADAKSSHPKPIKACPGHQINAAHCHALVVSDPLGKPQTSSTPAGYGPAQFHGAYSLPTTALSLQTIAIVDAYDDPTIRNDLSVYSQTYGIPDLPTCTSPSDANACFIKVNQTGGTSSYPRKDAGWALEISLDVEMAHAICQNCKIILVEASSNSFANLAAAVDEAATLGANVISNSYGGSEFSSETSASYDGHFNHAGIAITHWLKGVPFWPAIWACSGFGSNARRPLPSPAGSRPAPAAPNRSAHSPPLSVCPGCRGRPDDWAPPRRGRRRAKRQARGHSRGGLLSFRDSFRPFTCGGSRFTLVPAAWPRRAGGGLTASGTSRDKGGGSTSTGLTFRSGADHTQVTFPTFEAQDRGGFLHGGIAKACGSARPVGAAGARTVERGRQRSRQLPRGLSWR